MIEPPPLQSPTRDASTGTPWPHAIIILSAAAVAAAAVLIADAPWSSPDEFAISRTMGGLFCVYAGAGVIAAIVYFCTRKHSLWPTTITAAALMLILGLPVSLTSVVKRSLDSKTVWRDLDTINAHMLDEIRQASEGDAASVDVEAIYNQHAAELAKLESRVRGNELALLKTGVGFARDMATITGSYQNSVRPFLKAGGLHADTLTSREVVAQRRRMVRFASITHQTTLASLEKTPQDLATRLARQGVADADASKMVNGMLAGMHFPKLLQIHRLEGQMLSLMDEHLADLEKRYDHWKLEGGKIKFDSEMDEQSLARFNERIRKIQSLANEEKGIQNELLASRQGAR
jgi:hypothetical protein